MDPLTLIAVAGLGIAAFSALRAKEAEAAVVPSARAPTLEIDAIPAPTVESIVTPDAGGIDALGVALTGAAIAAVAGGIASVQAAGELVGTWDQKALQFIADGRADALIISGADVNAVLAEIIRTIGPSPAQWFTSDPIPTVKATILARIKMIVSPLRLATIEAQEAKEAAVKQALLGFGFKFGF